MNVVVLAPHTDDEVLGCGGTIAKLVERGYDVYVFAFSVGSASHKEFNDSVHKLGGHPALFPALETRHFSERRQDILDFLINVRDKYKPAKVFLPASSDVHQDHQVINQEGIRAFKHSTIYGCEYPWNSFNFSNGCYSTLSPEHINKKILALTSYESQQDRIYFKEENIISLARVRGMQANVTYAECFEVIRQFI
jgi:LmbE family N-acetylglucosaminyl deacetylase